MAVAPRAGWALDDILTHGHGERGCRDVDQRRLAAQRPDQRVTARSVRDDHQCGIGIVIVHTAVLVATALKTMRQATMG